ncbi:hypothetical protein DFH08DRAFT_1081354 [Mycena albidolilacea]|uniref:G-protein coupled receptors family 2 profile 2 domain-containing protein n=1 Tax=Mycena albidolilacea TaxID=1033008 RepID=A0AAD6ZZH2_9AGAR|nr:hypothetical protein DFH08DRAFT_1081354 [Mycena albidolilacea]
MTGGRRFQKKLCCLVPVFAIIFYYPHRSFFPPSVMSDSKELSFDNHLRPLVLGILIPGIVLSATVLMAFAYTASQRLSRPHLHRVSFRLLVYALVSNFILSVTLIPAEMLMKGPISPAGCAFAALAVIASHFFSTCMYFCMALNLQLVLVHGVNGLKMEKYYVMGSSLLVAVCTIAPLATGQLGPYDGICWFNNPDPVLQLRWLVGAQSFWILLMALSELVCFVILASYMIHHRISVKRMLSGISTKMTTSESQHTSYIAAPLLQFRVIILRITLYPLLSSVLNFSNIILDLYIALRLGGTELTFRLNVLDICIVCARPFLYAVLAATDPSFLRAVRAVRQPPIAGRSGTQHGPTSRLQSQSSRSTTPSSGTLTQVDGNKADGDGASRGREPGDAEECLQQTEADIHPMHLHRDTEQGIAPDSSVVQSRTDSIEFQI